MVCSGSIISGGAVERCIFSPRVRVNSYANVSRSILFEGVHVGRHCRIDRAVIDKGVRIPDGTSIGIDRELDLQRGLTLSEDGVVVVPRNARL
jgi:glucose-1-phosphate adenylyltransferase